MKKFDSLSHDVLRCIFDQFHPSERRRSLRSVLETNRALHHFAVQEFYRDLVLHAEDVTGRFRKDIEQLRKGGLGEKYLIHARNVKIWDYPLSRYVICGSREESPLDKWKVLRYRKEWVEEFGNLYRLREPQEMEAQNLVVWQALAVALESFKNLYNLIWVCREKFPPCLLRVIHEKHKNCQLHLRCFLPRSVSQDGINHEHDQKLMESPNLHSVTFKLPRTGHPCTSEEYKRAFDWYEVAALQVVITAPKIKHVNIVTGFEKSSGPLHPNSIANLTRDRKDLWKTGMETKASLTSLIFNRWRHMGINDIEEWSNCVDLSQVSNLMLGHVSDHQVLSYLVTNVGSWSLKTFGIDLSQTTHNRSLIDRLTSLVNELNCLREIHLGGYYLTESLLDKVLKRCGPRLYRMTLSPVRKFGSPEIQKIASHCQQLQFLKMSIQEPHAYMQLPDVCPDLDTLQELTLQIDGAAKRGIPQYIEAIIRQQKRTPLHYLKFFDDWEIFYFSKSIPTQPRANLSKSLGNGSSLPSVGGFRQPISTANEAAPTSWMIETELTTVFHGLPTAQFRQGEPIYPSMDSELRYGGVF